MLVALATNKLPEAFVNVSVCTLVIPEKVVTVAPRATAVEPIVTLELANFAFAIEPANEAFAIFVIVLSGPLIVLFVNV